MTNVKKSLNRKHSQQNFDAFFFYSIFIHFIRIKVFTKCSKLCYLLGSWKLVHICRSYGQLSRGLFFYETPCTQSGNIRFLASNKKILRGAWIRWHTPFTILCPTNFSISDCSLASKGTFIINTLYHAIHVLNMSFMGSGQTDKTYDTFFNLVFVQITGLHLQRLDHTSLSSQSLGKYYNKESYHKNRT